MVKHLTAKSTTAWTNLGMAKTLEMALREATEASGTSLARRTWISSPPSLAKKPEYTENTSSMGGGEIYWKEVLMH